MRKGTINLQDIESYFEKPVSGWNKLIAVLSYIFPIIPVITAFSSRQKSSFTIFHTNQSLALWLVDMAVNFLMSYIASLLDSASSTLGLMIDIFGLIVFLAGCVCWCIGIIGGLKGREYRIPLIYKIKLIKK